MNAFELTFHGVGTGHQTWKQVVANYKSILGLAVDPKTRQIVAGWQAIARFMEHASHACNPGGLDHQHWGQTADYLRYLQQQVDREFAIQRAKVGGAA